MIRNLILRARHKKVKFYNISLTEIQDDVEIGEGSRIGSFTLIQSGAKIGKNCTIGSFCNICGDVEIGDNVSIQTGCHITRGVKIDSDTFIGPGVVTMNDKYMNDIISPPSIGSHTRVGGGSCILPDLHIGKNVLIGSGCVVTKSIADGERVYGNPAKSAIKKANN
ncbi:MULTISPECIES: acyltransferase [unclassified Lentimicrobium]|uniref:acyltransferase n=1 Tax=unclassified Lentimicrobium TaxID=2677434 RepID=UPI00155735E5|nr:MULTISPECIES: acyltransferase [unclassified Lentimicrobium]NPD45543.1 N-acetyltransferase [Lentimicrobium sp. S6]NPD83622.1 N-acetyltransferase [Lentimicrobium sp. L6]